MHRLVGKSTKAVVASISSITKIAEQAGLVFSRIEFSGVGGLQAYTGNQL